MRFDDLQLFGQVARLGSLSAVARERDVPVSQISRALARIEAAIGARLVHRTTHGLSLSNDGERFLEHCHQATEVLERMGDDFAQPAQRLAGRVRVAVSPVMAHYWITPSLDSLLTRHPGLRIDLRVEDRFVDMAREGIDIAIRSGGAGGDQFLARRIGSFGRRVYAAPGYLKRFGLPDTVDALRSHRLIGNSAVTSLNRWRFVIDGEPVALEIEPTWSSDNTGITAELALQGLGIARMATIVGDPLVRAGRLVEVLPAFTDAGENPILALTLTRRQRPARVGACIDHWANWFEATLRRDGPASSARPLP